MAATAPVTGSLTTTGSVNLPKKQTDTLSQFQVSGTYGTVTFVFEGSVDNTNYFAVAAVNKATGAIVTGSVAPVDNSTVLYDIPSAGLTDVRLRTTAVGSGTLAVYAQAASFVGIPAVSSQSNSTFGATTFSSGITFNGATTVNTLSIPDNLADALSVKEGSTAYLTFVSTDSAEQINVRKPLGFPGSTGTNLMYLTDNLASALDVTESSNSYLKFVTTNSAEKIVAAKPLFLSNAATLAAAGSAQGDAGAIVNQVTFVSAADGTTGVVLPAATAGDVRFVYNLHASAGLKIYPASGDDINDATSDQAVTIEGRTLAIFVALDTSTWAGIYTANS